MIGEDGSVPGEDKTMGVEFIVDRTELLRDASPGVKELCINYPKGLCAYKTEYDISCLRVETVEWGFPELCVRLECRSLDKESGLIEVTNFYHADPAKRAFPPFEIRRDEHKEFFLQFMAWAAGGSIVPLFDVMMGKY